jgi:hypothetical protein
MEKILVRGFQLIKWQLNYHYLYHNKKKNHKRYHAVGTDTTGTVPKPNRKMVQRCKIDTPNTQIHARLLQGFQYKVVVLMKLFYGHTPK